MISIAVIMSVYKNDRLDFVKESIQSVLNQSYLEFDLYIQFDGAVKPDVEDYIDSISDSRVIVRKRNENKGLAYSLNELLEVVMSKGYEFIARMDADDICMPNRFQRQIEYMREHPEIECLGTWAIEILSDGSEYFRKKMPVSHADCLELFKKRDCMIHPTVMYRRSYIEKAGFYSLDTYFGEDTMMWAQGFQAGCVFGNVPEYLLKFRLDDNFFNRRRGWKHATSIFKLRRRVNKMLHFNIICDLWALAYAVAKLMPQSLLSLIYKIAR